MSSGNSHAPPTLTPEARKHLLLVACTLDRLDLMANSRPTTLPFRTFSQLAALPWFETVAGIVQRALPRKLRLLFGVWQTWNKSRRRRR